MTEYAELRCRTNFSFLEGASHPEELVREAHRLGLGALAITDRGGVHGVVRAHTEAKPLGLPILIGTEWKLPSDKSLILIALSRIGYANLCKLVSANNQKKPIDLSAHVQDLLALAIHPYPTGELASLREWFGDRLSIAHHRTLEASDAAREREAIELSQRHSIPIVATNDVHYHSSDRQRLQDVLTAIRHRTTVEKAGFLLFPNAERRLKSPQEMNRLFRDQPAWIRRSMDLAEQSHFAMDELRYVYPNEFLPPGKTTNGYLEELTWEGANRIYSGDIPENVTRQIRHELRLIEQLQFADFFLTIWDIMQFAKRQSILCQGRGSAANSAVCYALGITAIDPVRMNLLFERFISAERGEPPDIDVDFEHERREEVIQYIYKRYGRDRAGMVAEVTCYRSRSALREVAKALGLPHAQANKLSKSFHWRDFSRPNEVFLKENGISPRSRLGRELIPLVREISGFPRHLSIHVGGFVLTREPLLESVPIQPAAIPGRTIVQWNKDDLDALGMLKVDILGLGILTAIRKCMDLVNVRRPDVPPLTLATLPSEDPKVYDMICKADTIGVFQIESRAQMGMLPRLQPRHFHDLVIEVAIVRPGPIQGGLVHPFLRRRRGEEEVIYAHPALRPILEKTCGVPLFQEQVMKMAVAVAGFTPGEADELRRAMGIWRTSRSKPFVELADRFISGMRKNGITQENAEAIFKQIQGFGEFGFPESHSASFALLVYASAYLKCYHPAAYACALLNSLPMGFYAPHSILEDVRRHGVAVLSADLLHSQWNCTLEGDSLRVGLQFVRGLNQSRTEASLQEHARKPFSSIEDVAARSSFNRLDLFQLAAADAFRSFGLDRRQALFQLQALAIPKEDLHSGRSLNEPAVQFPPLSSMQRVATDYHLLGFSTFAHPALFLRDQMNCLGAAPAEALPQVKAQRVRCGGMVIVRQSPPTAKGMVFLTLEDETGFINVAISPPNYTRLRPIVGREPFLLVEGKLQRDGLSTSILVDQAWPLQFKDTRFTDRARNFH